MTQRLVHVPATSCTNGHDAAIVRDVPVPFVLYLSAMSEERGGGDNKIPKRFRSPLHPGIAADANLMIELVKRDIPITKETKLLEVGCGTGLLTFHLDRVCTVHGIDSSPGKLALNPVDNTSVMDVQHLSLDDDSYDVVFEHDLLRTVPDMNLALQEMKRVSKKYVVVAEPNILNLANLLSSVLVPSEWKARRFLRVLRSRISLRGTACESCEHGPTGSSFRG